MCFQCTEYNYIGVIGRGVLYYLLFFGGFVAVFEGEEEGGAEEGVVLSDEAL